MTTSPNGLARGPMVEIQRARILDAMIEACREHGAAAVAVSHVVARAGVSRRTFYELFSDREECFLAAFDEAIMRVSQRVRESHDSQASWRVRTRATLAAVLELFDEQPALGGLLLVESLRAGPAVLERRFALIERLIAEVDAARLERGGVRSERGGVRSERAGSRSEPGSSRAQITRLTGEGVVGAALSIVQTRLSEARREPLRKLTSPLMAMIVLPYLGAAAAGEELAMPLAPRRPQPPSRGPAEPLRGLDLRLTYRTVMVLRAVASRPGASNRQIGELAGVSDQGQISKLLRRLERLAFVCNDGVGQTKGMPNAWSLTPKGENIVRATGELVDRGASAAPSRPAASRARR